MNELIFSDRITSFRFKTLSFIYFSAFKEMLVIMGDFQVGIQYWNWNKQIYCELELELFEFSVWLLLIVSPKFIERLMKFNVIG